MSFVALRVHGQRDPRIFQIAALSGLLSYGVFSAGFNLSATQVIVTLSAVLATQYCFSKQQGLAVDLRSALITGISLCLLLRTDNVMLAALAGTTAISSKFLLRYRHKHIFNPANFALISLSLVFSAVWTSPGQWGQSGIIVTLLVGLGLLVLNRARHAETSLAFLLAYAALVTGRALCLGDPLSIPVHQLSNGALLVFTFFMISDPKTAPNHRLGRILFAAGVAALGFVIEFELHRASGPLIALFLLAPTVPILDRFFTAQQYTWRAPNPSRHQPTDLSTQPRYGATS